MASSGGGSSKKIETGGFPKSLKTGTGLQQQKDLSHKVSAKQTDVMFQAVVQDPSHLQSMLPEIQTATKVPRTQVKKLQMDVDYLSQHAPYTQAPMSPKSQQATYGVFDKFANKNENNLRPRPDTENRSIGEFPHFNVNQGNLSPRSQQTRQVVSSFEQHYSSQLDSDQLQLTQSYTQFEQRINTYGSNFGTSNQTTYASDVRNKKF
jgi:hypothetical protein